jgi:hypothetical protein
VVKVLGTITEFGYNRFADVYGFDMPGAIVTGWTDYIVSNSVVPPTLPNTAGWFWYYEKLPTTAPAKVDFDP